MFTIILQKGLTALQHKLLAVPGLLYGNMNNRALKRMTSFLLGTPTSVFNFNFCDMPELVEATSAEVKVVEPLLEFLFLAEWEPTFFWLGVALISLVMMSEMMFFYAQHTVVIDALSLYVVRLTVAVGRLGLILLGMLGVLYLLAILAMYLMVGVTGLPGGEFWVVKSVVVLPLVDNMTNLPYTKTYYRVIYDGTLFLLSLTEGYFLWAVMVNPDISSLSGLALNSLLALGFLIYVQPPVEVLQTKVVVPEMVLNPIFLSLNKSMENWLPTYFVSVFDYILKVAVYGTNYSFATYLTVFFS